MSEALKLEKKTIEDYLALPEGAMVELINGVMYDMSPAPLTIHQRLSGNIFFEILSYIKKKGGRCEVFTAPFDVRLNDETIVQPDISVICDPTRITRRGCVGAPDFIIEIVSSHRYHDYVRKHHLYADSGVKEYWIVDPDRKSVNVYLLSEEYSPAHYTFDDDIPVSIYNGDLKLNIAEMLE